MIQRTDVTAPADVSEHRNPWSISRIIKSGRTLSITGSKKGTSQANISGTVFIDHFQLLICIPQTNGNRFCRMGFAVEIPRRQLCPRSQVSKRTHSCHRAGFEVWDFRSVRSRESHGLYAFLGTPHWFSQPVSPFTFS